jgi:hypothetical protein
MDPIACHDNTGTGDVLMPLDALFVTWSPWWRVLPDFVGSRFFVQPSPGSGTLPNHIAIEVWLFSSKGFKLDSPALNVAAHCHTPPIPSSHLLRLFRIQSDPQLCPGFGNPVPGIRVADHSCPLEPPV